MKTVIARSDVNEISWDRYQDGTTDVEFRMVAVEDAFFIDQEVRVDGNLYKVIHCSMSGRINLSGSLCHWTVRASRVVR